MNAMVRTSASVVLGAALAGAMFAGSAQAAAPAVGRSAAGHATAAPQHGPSWVAGYFHDFGSCQAAGRQGQWRHSWGRYECQQQWGKSYGDRHDGNWHDGNRRDGHRHLNSGAWDSGTWVLTVWR